MVNYRKIKISLILLLFVLIGGCSDIHVQVPPPTDDKGHLEVAIQDQFSKIVDLRLTQEIAQINLTQNYTVGDTRLNISSSVLPVFNDILCLKEDDRFYQGEILDVTSLGGTLYEVRVDKPLDYNYTTAGGCSIREDDWAVDGSVTPQVFAVSPSGLNENVSWDITRVILVCLGDGVAGGDPTPDLSSFFTTDPITNGITFRQVNGEVQNIFNAKDNFHLVSETYDLTIYPANRFGFFAVTSRRTFNGPDKNGVTVRLNAATSDRFELIINDDLTDMEQCHAVIQGHVVE